jgi:hypothetical protein
VNPATRGARVGVASLAVLFLALHLPFLPQSLEDLDSVNFALGIRDFDVANHQPHPPGYPLFILAAKALHLVVGSEAHVLSLLNILAGAAGICALAVFVRRLDGGRNMDHRDHRALAATALTATAPLYWFTASRPLSDLPGLAAAIGVQALTLAGPASLPAAAFLAGLASGIRSQVAWLTLPLLAYEVIRLPASRRLATARTVTLMLAAGVLIWFIPLVFIEGGPASYWRALSSQGAEDLSGVQMLWTNRSPRQVLLVLNSTFVAPWAHPALAAALLACAAAGLAVLALRARAVLAILIAAYGPYLLFDVVFQESITTRYALPVVVPLAYCAARGAMVLPVRLATAVVGVLAVVSMTLAQTSVVQYASLEAPAFRLLHDMKATAEARSTPPVALGMHRREDLDFRRSIAWEGEKLPKVAQRLPAPPKREWLEAVKYWNSGGRAPVWFVADPLRSDLALIDRAQSVRSYRWPLTYPALIGGARPNEMDWHELDRPGWFLGQGWALTPESAGVALEDKRGPGIQPIQGWVLRRADLTTMMIGGRNLTADGAPAVVRVRLDGRPIDEAQVSPGFFLRLLSVPPAALQGAGDYATLEVEAAGNVAIEQFDAQSADRVVFGYGDGWHELEYNPIRGQLWRWMSEKGVVRVRGTGATHTLYLQGVTEGFSRPSLVRVRVGARVLAQQSVGSSFDLQVVIPGELIPAADGLITIESDQFYVPAERSADTQDGRHLALKILQCRLEP